MNENEVASHIAEAAKALGLFVEKERTPWELPRGIVMQRFTGDGFRRLVGQYVNDRACGAQRPRRVYEIMIVKECDYQFVEILDDGALIAEMKVFANSAFAEYMGLKALKAFIARHDKKNAQAHRRRAAKKERASVDE